MDTLHELVDISSFCDPKNPFDSNQSVTEELRNVAHRLIRNLSTTGFVHITGHFIDNQLLNDAFGITNTFFLQPIEEKMNAVSKDRARRGYSPYQTENFSSLAGENKPNDLVEKFRMGPIDLDSTCDDADAYYSCKEGRIHFFPNTFQGTPVEMEAILTAYYKTMESLTLHILSIIEIGLNISKGTFRSYMSRHTSILGLNFFPEIRLPLEPPAALRIAEHTDVSMLTIIAHQTGGVGLDICTKGGIWREIEPISGALIVNVGDCLQYWTCGRLKSTVHRVSIPQEERPRECTITELEGLVHKYSEKESVTETSTALTFDSGPIIAPCRMSIAFFATPNHDAPLSLSSASSGIGEEKTILLRTNGETNKEGGMTYSQWRR